MRGYTVDKHGRTRIPVGMPENRPGAIEVDGDLYEERPVAIIRFETTSEPGVPYPEGEVDFGTFRLQARGEFVFSTVVTLNREQALALANAIKGQVDA